MSRPVGVTASAIVAILGSLFTLLMAVVVVASSFVATPQSQAASNTGFAIGGALFLAALGALGIATAIGLFRMRQWARTSILVFAGFITVVGTLMLLMTMVVPIPVPPDADPAIARAIRPTLIALFSVPVAIGVWWLVQFNAQGTRAAFASLTPATAPRRPLSISIIAWVSLIGGISCLFPILARMPAFLLGVTFTGWAAGVVYAFFGALSMYIGWGLLDLRERARVIAIGWFAFSLIHMSVVTLVPALRQRMLELQRSISQNQPGPPPFDPAAFANVSLAFFAVMMAAALWFLIRNRAAFRADAAAG
jgi:hypothetical protein